MKNFFIICAVFGLIATNAIMARANGGEKPPGTYLCPVKANGEDSKVTPQEAAAKCSSGEKRMARPRKNASSA